MLGRTLLAVGLIGAALWLVGCSKEKEGSGVAASERRNVGSFSRVLLSGEASVVVTVGGELRVTVRADDNLLRDVDTQVQDSTLEISQPDNLDLAPKVGIDVDITVPTLEGVEVSGSGDVSVDGIRGDVFQTEVSGAGNVHASGQVDRVEAVVSGAGDVRLVDLVAREAIVEISGAGDIHVHATESLTASVSGAGDVIYTGDPEEVNRDVSGAGEIRPE
jgi:Putative auto-transporter adhesin, head GIN domain